MLVSLQQFTKQMKSKQKPYYDDKWLLKLDFYMDKCVELSWFMVNQSPALCLDDTTVSKGDIVDRDAFRLYKHRGSKVDYLVWPALYLASSNGFLLVQGVIQPVHKAQVQELHLLMFHVDDMVVR